MALRVLFDHISNIVWLASLLQRNEIDLQHEGRLKVENITEVQEIETEVVWPRDETKTTSEDKHWRWYHLGEEEEEERSRDGWTVSTETREPSER